MAHVPTAAEAVQRGGSATSIWRVSSQRGTLSGGHQPVLEAHERGDHGLVGSPVGESGEGAARPAAREPSAREAIEECAELQHELEQTRDAIGALEKQGAQLEERRRARLASEDALRARLAAAQGVRKTLQGALAEQRAALRRTASRAEEESFWERFQASATPAPRAPHPMTRAMGHAAAAAAAGGGQREKVAVTGATGFVGVRLVEMLQAAGYDVVALTRDPLRARSRLPDGVDAVASADWARAMRGCCAVINLAGEPVLVAKRWSEPIKREIKASRVRATRRVAEAIQALGDEAPPVLVSASAIGYYGTSNAESGFDEAAPSGGDYLAEVCREWEAEAQQAGAQRTVVVRIGVVLDSGGGALAKMMPVFQLGAGGPLGSGSQWFSWIHRDDLCALLVESVRNGAYSGVINATAPRPVRMGEFCAALGRATGRPSWLPVPSFAIEALLGEGATVVLEGQRVLPAAAESKGFKFRYTDIDGALEAIVRRGI